MDLGSVKDIDDLYSGFDDDNPALAADVVSFPLEPWNTLPWRVQLFCNHHHYTPTHPRARAHLRHTESMPPCRVESRVGSNV